MPTMTTEQLRQHVLELISLDQCNEDAILKLLPRLDKQSVNHVFESDYGQETMLMWAVWRQKINVVEKLLDMDADPEWTNLDGENALTYWDLTLGASWKAQSSPETMYNYCQLARILHTAGCNLAGHGYSSQSYYPVQRAVEYNISPLNHTLRDLRYNLD